MQFTIPSICPSLGRPSQWNQGRNSPMGVAPLRLPCHRRNHPFKDHCSKENLIWYSYIDEKHIFHNGILFCWWSFLEFHGIVQKIWFSAIFKHGRIHVFFADDELWIVQQLGVSPTCSSLRGTFAWIQKSMSRKMEQQWLSLYFWALLASQLLVECACLSGELQMNNGNVKSLGDKFRNVTPSKPRYV